MCRHALSLHQQDNINIMIRHVQGLPVDIGRGSSHQQLSLSRGISDIPASPWDARLVVCPKLSMEVQCPVLTQEGNLGIVLCEHLNGSRLLTDPQVAHTGRPSTVCLGDDSRTHSELFLTTFSL